MVRLLGRFPALLFVGCVVLLHTAVEMILEDPFVHDRFPTSLVVRLVITAIVSAAFIGVAIWQQRRATNLAEPAH